MQVRFDQRPEETIYLWPANSAEILGPLCEVSPDVYDRLVNAKLEYNRAMALVRENVVFQEPPRAAAPDDQKGEPTE